MEKKKARGLINTEQFLVDHWPKILAAAGAVCILLIGAGTWNHFNNKGKEETLDKIYVYTQKLAGPKKAPSKEDPKAPSVETKHIPSEDVLREFTLLQKEVGSDPAILGPLFNVVEAWREKGKHQEAVDILLVAKENLSGNMYAKFFVLQALATQYEDLHDYIKAMEVQKEMLSQKFILAEHKIHLDLARLHLLMNDKEKAKKKFQEVVAKYHNTQSAKLAKAYLRFSF